MSLVEFRRCVWVVGVIGGARVLKLVRVDGAEVLDLEDQIAPLDGDDCLPNRDQIPSVHLNKDCEVLEADSLLELRVLLGSNVDDPLLVKHMRVGWLPVLLELQNLDSIHVLKEIDGLFQVVQDPLIKVVGVNGLLLVDLELLHLFHPKLVH